MAHQLVANLTSASRVAMRAEAAVRVREVLQGMNAVDREVLSLRHFEGLTNGETAQVLGISDNAASNRYVRALMHLREAMDEEEGMDAG